MRRLCRATLAGVQCGFIAAIVLLGTNQPVPASLEISLAVAATAAPIAWRFV
jgi:hypothetical protein